MTVMLQLPSPIEEICFKGVRLYLKRDDLIDPDFSGNKARKFHYFLAHDLPNINRVVSYGSAQSNAMYSLSVLAKKRGWRFEYYVDHIADYLREAPHGNYAGALKNGMLLRQAPQPFPGFVDENNKTLFIEEGGRQKEAGYGIKFLAQEILDWQIERGIKELNIFLPSGTGTTALFLQKSLFTLHSSLFTQVYTCACVGDSAYLKEQFLMLASDEGCHPVILSLEKKHHFGKLYKDNYKIWLELQQETGVVFDLLYDPLGWRTMFAHPELFEHPVLYIHQGGVLGNASMLPRYKRKYPDLKL